VLFIISTMQFTTRGELPLDRFSIILRLEVSTCSFEEVDPRITRVRVFDASMNRPNELFRTCSDVRLSVERPRGLLRTDGTYRNSFSRKSPRPCTRTDGTGTRSCVVTSHEGPLFRIPEARAGRAQAGRAEA